MKKKSLNLIFVLAIFICMLDTTVMNVSLPAISESLDTDLDTLSWALNAYTIIFASLTIPLTRIADMWGKTRCFLLGALAFGLGSLLSGLADSFTFLLVGRVIQALGAATLLPLAMVMGIEAAAPAARRNTIALLGTTQGLAAAMGPIIGGIVTQWLSWHWIFFINIPLVLVIMLMTWLNRATLPQGRKGQNMDWPGSLLSIITLASLTTLLIKGRTWGWASPLSLSVIALILISFILFIWREKTAKEPMIPLSLFASRQFSGASIVLVLSSLFLVAISVILPTYFVNIEGFSTLNGALMITPTMFAIFIVAPIAGFLQEKTGIRWLIFVGLCLMAAGYASYGFTDALTQVWSACLAGVLVGAGYGMIMGPVTAAAVADFTGPMLSASQSVTGVLRQVGVVLAVAIFVSGLYANLQSAKKESIQDAERIIKTSDMPTQLKPIVIQSATKKLQSSTGNTGKSAKTGNPVIDQSIQKVQTQSKTNYRLAFKKLYRYALPVILLSLLTIFIFKRR
ncbi:MFS transporter [Eupransor demetentiae]|uniref:Includes anhydromuropeptide permease AmpG (ProP) n=1 Tax=Eupransor demetentiae TaxID=3109584 RepID=A0ABP0ESV8_9LACO|nr:MFS family permease [Lactobacillaceae bacterium LMG 33000]